MFEQIFRCKGNYCLHLLKGKIIELIRGNDGKVRRVKLNVYQTKPRKTVVINRPLQLIVPFEIASESPEPAETIALSNHLVMLPKLQILFVEWSQAKFELGSVKNVVFKSRNLMWTLSLNHVTYDWRIESLLIGWLLPYCVVIEWHIFDTTLISNRVLLLQKIWTSRSKE